MTTTASFADFRRQWPEESRKLVDLGLIIGEKGSSALGSLELEEFSRILSGLPEEALALLGISRSIQSKELLARILDAGNTLLMRSEQTGHC